MAALFTDNSYPPITPGVYQYTRGDGARVTMTIEHGPQPSVTQNIPALTVEPVERRGPRIVEIEAPQELQIVGKLEGRPFHHTVATAPRGEKRPIAPVTDSEIFDHPTIGGKITVFVLLYGDYHDLHKQCLNSLIATTSADRVEIRVGSNMLCQESVELIEKYMEEGRISLHYRHLSNDKKYPVMREMFHDPENPIRTKYLIWFDDDTICNKATDWLRQLATTIVHHHDTNHRYYGPQYLWKLSTDQIRWIREASWYQGRAFKDAQGKEQPNGDKVFFATGSFWALEVAAMRRCNIPDPRIGHNGGDYMIGEQVHQGGYKLKQFNQKKQIVNWSSVARRGLNEKHAGKT